MTFLEALEMFALAALAQPIHTVLFQQCILLNPDWENQTIKQATSVYSYQCVFGYQQQGTSQNEKTFLIEKLFNWKQMRYEAMHKAEGGNCWITEMW